MYPRNCQRDAVAIEMTSSEGHWRLGSSVRPLAPELEKRLRKSGFSGDFDGGYPKNAGFIMENAIKMDDLGAFVESNGVGWQWKWLVTQFGLAVWNPLRACHSMGPRF